MSNYIDQIISLIFAVRKLTHEQDTKKKGKCVSFLQFIALRYIKDNGPLMKEVADFLEITPPSATSLVEILAEAGQVRRIYDKNDRRNVRLEITARGKAYLKKGVLEMQKKMRKNLEILNEKEQKNLTDILSKIVNASR